MLLVFQLGGDGTVLYASSLFQRIVPPVLSFALGSLGFLTKFDYDGFPKTLTRADCDVVVGFHPDTGRFYVAAPIGRRGIFLRIRGRRITLSLHSIRHPIAVAASGAQPLHHDVSMRCSTNNYVA